MTKWKTEGLNGPFQDTAQADAEIRKNLVPPPEWRAAWPEKYGYGYNTSNLPDLKTWERFQVWMRTAGLYTFRMLDYFEKDTYG